MSIIRSGRAEIENFSRSTLYRRYHGGELERIGRGLYIPAGAEAADWDQAEAALLRPESTLSLVSALNYYGLTDQIPDALDVAIPRGTRPPVTSGAIRWRQFDHATFLLERSEIPIAGTSERIGIYSAERTIADCFRMRSSIGYEVPRDALKEWLRRGGKPADLMRIASSLPRSKAPVLQALDILS
ncbi:type IV toxin-antitoxin system AbiEi family antitoxin domain-containing protein [Mycetocola saprophilus]|uniref:type IV toxin-antitoxin system AbiEi family antitoxin domain-containing protein n=1 Tax=Mycetocola saprophilus TaxID=76636 RepID=UPI0004BE5733|nr:type IV toxin-antitoxin system AbiEi family antitoxin [Mycetocola saprophilus]